MMFASAGKTLQLSSLERSGLKTIYKHVPRSNEDIAHVSWCHDNSYIAILQENDFPQILSTKDPTQITLVHTISTLQEVSALRFKSNTKRILALGTKTGDVVLYDTKNRCVSRVLGKLPGTIVGLEFVSVNELAVIANDLLVVFNVNDSERTELTNPDMCTTLRTVNKSAGHVAVGCVNGLVAIWDVGAKCKVQTYHLHSGAVTGLAVSNKDMLLVTSGTDHKICIIDKISRQCVFKKVLHQPIASIDISGNDQYMLAGLNDGSIYIYQLADHLKPQICSKVHYSPVNQISFVNSFSLEAMESDSILGEEQENESIHNKELTPSPSVNQHELQPKDSSNDNAIVSETMELINEGINNNNNTPRKGEFSTEETQQEDMEISEEKVKLDLIKLINSHFGQLEGQLTEHCTQTQGLVSDELNSLYAVAARWECFKTMELDEIVRYICGIVNASSETKVLSQKSDHHTELQPEKKNL